jgi:hypothetical protein
MREHRRLTRTTHFFVSFQTPRYLWIHFKIGNSFSAFIGTTFKSPISECQVTTKTERCVIFYLNISCLDPATSCSSQKVRHSMKLTLHFLPIWPQPIPYISDQTASFHWDSIMGLSPSFSLSICLYFPLSTVCLPPAFSQLWIPYALAFHLIRVASSCPRGPLTYYIIGDTKTNLFLFV